MLAVNISKVQPKPKRRGVHKGTKQGWKKAIIKVHKDDEIQVLPGHRCDAENAAHFRHGKAREAGRLMALKKYKPTSPGADS